MIWLCTEDVVTNENKIAFTKGKKYRGENSATPLGQRAIAFLNDLGEDHLTFGSFLYNRFVRVCPECEQTEVTFNTDNHICDNCVLNNLEIDGYE